MEPHFIYHNSNIFYLYLCGDDAELKVYPASSNVLETSGGKLYKIYTREREQLISLGKSGSLGFSYLIKQPIDRKVATPSIIIRDQSGAELSEDIYTKLPKSKYISISCQYDGKAVVRRNQKIEYIYKLNPDQGLIIDGLSYGTAVDFYQGCDCIRTLCFERLSTEREATAIDSALVKQLQDCAGPTVPITHSMGALASKYSTFPKTQKWLFATLRKGKLSRKALYLLEKNLPKR